MSAIALAAPAGRAVRDDLVRRGFGWAGALLVHLLVLALLLVPALRGRAPVGIAQGTGRPAAVFSLSRSDAAADGPGQDADAGAGRSGASTATAAGTASAPVQDAEDGGAPQGTDRGRGSDRALEQAIAGVVADDPLHGDDWYRVLLRQHLAMHRRTPGAGRGARSGTVVVRFTMGRDGHILDARVVASRGSRLDRAALATLWDSEPLPPVPASLQAPIEVDVPVDFVERG